MTQIDRKELLTLLEYPLGEDNLIPRMHSRAKSMWKLKIMRICDMLTNCTQDSCAMGVIHAKALEMEEIENPMAAPTAGIA